jgi:hypothetical protein
MTQEIRRDVEFTAESKMTDVLQKRPYVRAVLMQEFHIGGCSHCGFDANDTVRQVAEDNGVPVDRLLAAINR